MTVRTPHHYDAGLPLDGIGPLLDEHADVAAHLRRLRAAVLTRLVRDDPRRPRAGLADFVRDAIHANADRHA